MKRLIFVITALLLAAEVASPQKEADLEPGERIYREGILPSGKPLQAIIQGDIPVDGRMFTCVSCHLRSGLGSREGSVITPPVNGPYLYKARPVALRPKVTERRDNPLWKTLPTWFDGGDVRPAYTDESLALVLRKGRDPAGRNLDPIMPRLTLDEEDMALLIEYLKHLSPVISPGVTQEAITFATVVTEGVPPEDREVMLAVLNAYMASWNAQTRNQQRRALYGPFYHEEKNTSYRKLILKIWDLKGPEETWKGQLAAYDAKESVFALLGGISEGSWAPVHEFCEEKGLPALLPVTRRPVVSKEDWYTLYFDRGPFQEGEAAAKFLRRTDGIEGLELLHVYREHGLGDTAFKGFSTRWSRFKGKPPKPWILSQDGTSPGHLESTLKELKPDVLFLWLVREDVESVIELLVKSSWKPSKVFLSAGLLGTDFSFIPDSLREIVHVTHPFSLPGDEKRSLLALKQWLKLRKIPGGDLSIQSKMYFIGWMLSGALGMMRDDFYRDYFLDCWDMMIDQTYAIAVYPRLSFGPGQRYASKGCFIVQIEKGPESRLRKVSDWVIH